MPACEIQLKFMNCVDPVVVKNLYLINSIPLLRKAMKSQPKKNTTNPTISKISIARPRKGLEFIFSYVYKYKKPTEKSKLEDYPEANEKSIEDLTQIWKLAIHLECIDFMSCIAFVISKKMGKLSIVELAKYLSREK